MFFFFYWIAVTCNCSEGVSEYTICNLPNMVGTAASSMQAGKRCAETLAEISVCQFDHAIV